MSNAKATMAIAMATSLSRCLMSFELSIDDVDTIPGQAESKGYAEDGTKVEPVGVTRVIRYADGQLYWPVLGSVDDYVTTGVILDGYSNGVDDA